MTTNSIDPKKIRDDLRGKIFSNESRKRKSEIIEMFGSPVEVRQPNLGQVTKLSANPDKIAPIFLIMIEYCYVPNTDERLFSRADVEAMAELPTGQWLTDFNKAIERMTGIDVAGAEKNSEGTTSEQQST